MQSGGFFLFPALAVEGGEALEDFDAGGLGNRVADIVVRRKITNLVEAMSKINVTPAVGVAYSHIDLALQLAHLLQLGILLRRIVEQIVERRQPNTARCHNLPTNRVILITETFKRRRNF